MEIRWNGWVDWLTTGVEDQKPGFLEKLGFSCFGFTPECGFPVVAFPVQIVGEIRLAVELR